jgi:hypothetical protein
VSGTRACAHGSPRLLRATLTWSVASVPCDSPHCAPPRRRSHLHQQGRLCVLRMTRCCRHCSLLSTSGEGKKGRQRQPPRSAVGGDLAPTAGREQNWPRSVPRPQHEVLQWSSTRCTSTMLTTNLSHRWTHAVAAVAGSGTVGASCRGDGFFVAKSPGDAKAQRICRPSLKNHRRCVCGWAWARLRPPASPDHAASSARQHWVGVALLFFVLPNQQTVGAE